jgi:DNA-directed RNA polymerase specialized sigma24 family protein
VFRWDELRDPVAYACRAAITNFYKARQRDEQRLRRSVAAQRLDTVAQHDRAPDDIHKGDRVVELLSGLPQAQGEAMAYAVDGFSPAEVAGKVGKTSAAVRANLRHARRTLAARMSDSPDWDIRDSSESRDGRRTDD